MDWLEGILVAVVGVEPTRPRAMRKLLKTQ